MKRIGVLLGAVMMLGAGQEMPSVQNAVPPQKGADARPRAVVGISPYRHDDLFWENDRTAHRIYSEALEQFEPPSSSGMDAWAKNVRWPYMERQLRAGTQHLYRGEGLDFYHVGGSRGAGGLGIWFDNKLWVSRNWHRYRILQNGPDVARFEVSYAPWPVDVDRKVWETRRFSLPLGTNFTRMVSTIESDKPGTMLVGIGINKYSAEQLGTLHVDREHGKISWWGPKNSVDGTMGVALLVDPSTIEDVREDADNYLVILRETPGKPFVYYMGSAWDKGLDIHTMAEWDNYVKAQEPDFDPRHS